MQMIVALKLCYLGVQYLLYTYDVMQLVTCMSLLSIMRLDSGLTLSVVRACVNMVDCLYRVAALFTSTLMNGSLSTNTSMLLVRIKYTISSCTVIIIINLIIVTGITKVYPDSSGIRLVFTDDKSDAFLYNPINDTTIDVPDYPPSAVGLLWDMGPLEKVQYLLILLIVSYHTVV